MQKIYIDYQTSNRVDSNNARYVNPIDFYFQKLQIYEIYFLENGSPKDISECTAWKAIVADFGSTTRIIEVNDEDIDKTEANIGKLILTCDCDTAEYLAKVGSNSQYATSKFQIWGYDENGNEITTAIFEARLYNSLKKIGTPPSNIPHDYLTETETLAITNGISEDLADHEDLTTTAHGGLLASSDTTITKQGNSFNGSSQLVQTTVDGKLPILDGSNLTGIQAGIQTLTTSTPTNITGLIKGNGSTLSVASAGTDYVGVNDSRLSDSRTPTSHTHAESEVTGLVSDLAGKASSTHNHDSAYESKNSNIQSHISETTTAHGLTIANVVLTNDSRLSDSRTPTSHTHAESDVTNLVTDLAGKASSTHNHDSSYEAKNSNIQSHISETTTAHGLTIANVVLTNDSRLSDNRTPVSHTHAESDVTNLVTDLASKASNSHNHDTAYDSLGAASTVQGNLNSHANNSTSVHGLTIADVTTKGNTFNQANKLLLLDFYGKVDGDLLPSLSLTKRSGVPSVGVLPSGVLHFLGSDDLWHENTAVERNNAITAGTKTKITYDSKGLVTAGDNATTADIADSTDKRYVTDSQKTVLSNTSNTNSGDETDNSIKTKLGITTLSGSNTGDETQSTIKTKLGYASTSTDGYLTSTDWNTFNGKQNAGSYVTANNAITGATKTKITYDSKGLVTSGTDATTADIADSTDRRYCTDAQKTVIGNTSNTNSGDETTSTIKTKLGITTLSGSNTGDETTATIKTKLGYASGSTDGYLTSTDWTTFNGKASSTHNHSGVYEPVISSGTTSQYYRGDKSWQTLDKTAVGLGNVANLDTSNPANITQSATYRFVTDTEKTTWNGKQSALGYTAENTSNKVTSISGSSTDTQYPSAKLVYDQLATKSATGHTHTGTYEPAFTNLAYSKLPTGGGTWSNGGDLTISGATLYLGDGKSILLGNAVNGTSTAARGLFWHNDTTNYGIYRTSGAWSSPNYQQLKLYFETGILIDGGSAHGVSGTQMQPSGGCVSIGSITPKQGSAGTKLIIKGTGETTGRCIEQYDSNGGVVFCTDDDGNTNIGNCVQSGTLTVARGNTSNSGTCVFNGSTHASHFNYSSAEDTYIRGGKSGSIVYVNDNHAGRIILGGSGAVGINCTPPTNCDPMKMLIGGSVDYPTLKISRTDSGFATGCIALGDGNSSTVNVGIWRGPANSTYGNGNCLNLGAYDSVVIATGNNAIGSQTTRVTVTSSGDVYLPYVYSVTNGSLPYLRIQSDGRLFRDSSSRKYKDNITTFTTDWNRILEVKPRSYIYKETGDFDIGYIAEELDEIGLKDIVRYDNGMPDSIAYEKISLYLIEIIKDINNRIKTLEAKL